MKAKFYKTDDNTFLGEMKYDRLEADKTGYMFIHKTQKKFITLDCVDYTVIGNNGKMTFWVNVRLSAKWINYP